MNIASMIEVHNQPAFSVVRFFGFVDAGTVEQMRPVIDAKIPEACPNIIIDLDKVEFLDSHGIGFFVSLLKRAHRNKGRLVFAGATAQPASVLNIVGFNSSRVTYCDTLEQACALFQKPDDDYFGTAGVTGAG